MKVMSIRAQKDGSAMMKLMMDRGEYLALMRSGLQEMLGPKVKVLSVETARALGLKGGTRCVIVEAVADELVRQAVLTALKRRISAEEKRRLKGKGRKK